MPVLAPDNAVVDDGETGQREDADVPVSLQLEVIVEDEQQGERLVHHIVEDELHDGEVLDHAHAFGDPVGHPVESVEDQSHQHRRVCSLRLLDHRLLLRERTQNSVRHEVEGEVVRANQEQPDDDHLVAHHLRQPHLLHPHRVAHDRCRRHRGPEAAADPQDARDVGDDALRGEVDAAEQTDDDGGDFEAAALDNEKQTGGEGHTAVDAPASQVTPPKRAVGLGVDGPAAAEDGVEREEQHSAREQVGEPDLSDAEAAVGGEEEEREELGEEGERAGEEVRPDVALRAEQVAGVDGLDGEDVGEVVAAEEDGALCGDGGVDADGGEDAPGEEVEGEGGDADDERECARLVEVDSAVVVVAGSELLRGEGVERPREPVHAAEHHYEAERPRQTDRPDGDVVAVSPRVDEVEKDEPQLEPEPDVEREDELRVHPQPAGQRALHGCVLLLLLLRCAFHLIIIYAHHPLYTEYALRSKLKADETPSIWLYLCRLDTRLHH